MIEWMADTPQRRSPARVSENRMARVACELLEKALGAVGKADALAIQMEPLLNKRYGSSAIYAYTNRRSVPPGDVLLAAAMVTGMSVDDQLGRARKQVDLEKQISDLRAEVDLLRRELGSLRAERMDQEDWEAASTGSDYNFGLKRASQG
jgi:hypothetical protein